MSENVETRTPAQAFVRATEGRMSDCIQTGRAAWNCARESYDRMIAFVPTTSRKRWGRLYELVRDGWDNAASMAEAQATIDELIDELVRVGQRIKANSVGLVHIAGGLSQFGILRGAVERRVGELAEQQRAEPETDAPAGECVGGERATAAWMVDNGVVRFDT